MIKFLLFLILSALNVSISMAGPTGCSVSVDGYGICQSDINDWNGKPSSPSISKLGQARIYYDSTLQALRCSQNGGSYTNCVTPATAVGNAISGAGNNEVLYTDATGHLATNPYFVYDGTNFFTTNIYASGFVQAGGNNFLVDASGNIITNSYEKLGGPLNVQTYATPGAGVGFGADYSFYVDYNGNTQTVGWLALGVTGSLGPFSNANTYIDASGNSYFLGSLNIGNTGTFGANGNANLYADANGNVYIPNTSIIQNYNDTNVTAGLEQSQANPGAQMYSYSISADTSAYNSVNATYLSSAVRQGANGSTYAGNYADNSGNTNVFGGNCTAGSGGSYEVVGVNGCGGVNGTGNITLTDLNGHGLNSNGLGVFTFDYAPIVSSGTSSQFLKGNGTLDPTTYASTSSPTITTPSFTTSESINNTGTSKSCATSGTVTWYPVEQGTGKKEVIGYANACLGASASYTFPTAFAHTPAVLTTNELVSTLLSTLSTTVVVMTGTTSTGYIFIEGN